MSRTLDAPLRARFDGALREGSLDQLAVSLHDNDNWSKQEIYDTLCAFMSTLDPNAEDDREPVCEVLDVLTGWCAPSARLWPDEECIWK